MKNTKITIEMLLEERQVLLDSIQETNKSISGLIKSRFSISEIMNQRKQSVRLFLKTEKLLQKLNRDPLTKEQNKHSACFKLLQEINEFILKTK